MMLQGLLSLQWGGGGGGLESSRCFLSFVTFDPLLINQYVGAHDLGSHWNLGRKER